MTRVHRSRIFRRHVNVCAAETYGELRQGVRRQVGNPAAQATLDGLAWRARGEHSLPRDTVTDTAEPSIRATGV